MRSKAILSSCYLPPIQYLAVMNSYDTVIVDVYEHYVKQTYRNRCNIVTSSGVQALTVPVEKPLLSNAMKDMRISEHGNWRHLHLSALDSAYGNSPFYEYYRDDFLKFYTSRYESLVEYNTELLKLVCELMDIPFNIEFSSCYMDGENCGADDFRSVVSPKNVAADAVPADYFKPYYQVFSVKHGFVPNMSCVDLLFNMGPESPLVLNRLAGL